MRSAAPGPVLVTGGAGFIGCHSVEALLAEGHSVVVVDDLRHRSWRTLDPSADLLELDITSGACRDAIVRIRPSAVLHLAAQGGVNRSWRDPVADATTNVVGTVNVLGAALEAGTPRFVMASSGGALYGDAAVLPTPEDEPKAPRSPYGAAKLAAEGYLGTFGRIRGLLTLALRYGNVYGPGQDGTGEAGVVAITCERLLDGRAPVVRGDGSQSRDFVYVGDVAEANVRAVGSRAEGALNVGTGTGTSVGAVVETLRGLAGFADAAAHEPLPPGEVGQSALDPARAAAALGWAPSTTASAGLELTWTAFRERHAAPANRPS